MWHGFGVGWLARRLNRPSTGPDPEFLKLRAYVEQVQDEIAHERVARKALAADVEEMCEDARRVYAKARAAESRARKGTGEGVGPNGEQEPVLDPVAADLAARRAIMARAGPWGG